MSLEERLVAARRSREEADAAIDAAQALMVVRFVEVLEGLHQESDEELSFDDWLCRHQYIDDGWGVDIIRKHDELEQIMYAFINKPYGYLAARVNDQFAKRGYRVRLDDAFQDAYFARS